MQLAKIKLERLIPLDERDIDVLDPDITNLEFLEAILPSPTKEEDDGILFIEEGDTDCMSALEWLTRRVLSEEEIQQLAADLGADLTDPDHWVPLYNLAALPW